MEKENQSYDDEFDDHQRKEKKDEEESLFYAEPKSLGMEFGVVLHHTSFKVSENNMLRCETFLESTYLGEIPILTNTWTAGSGDKGFDDPDVHVLMIPIPLADPKESKRESKGGKGGDSDDEDDDFDESFSSLDDDDKHQADDKDSKRNSDSKSSEKK